MEQTARAVDRERELLERYVSDGYKAILCVGYSRGNKDYQTGKIPCKEGWNDPHYVPPTTDECIAHLNSGGWIGQGPPEGVIVLDAADTKNSTEDKFILDTYVAYITSENSTPGRHKSVNGDHFVFKGNGISAESKTFSALGLPLTYRTHNSQILFEPTPGRKWIKYVPTKDLPEILSGLRPYDKKKKDEVLNCLVYVVGKAYRRGLLNGWEDIDAAFTGFLVQEGIEKERCLAVLESIFSERYDEKRSENIYDRALERYRTGEPLVAAGTFVDTAKKIDDKEYPLIRFIKELSRLNKKGTKKKEKEPPQAELLINIGSSLHLFHDDTGEAHTELNGSVIKIRSSSFKQHLAREMWALHGKAPNSDALNQALNVLEAKANFEGEERTLHNRIAAHDGSFWYDLANGKAVRITSNHWEIVDNPPMIFRRYPHQQPQVMPISGGNINDLFKFANIPDDDHRLLLAVWFVSLFVPDIGHPVIHPYGDQGSGKTTLCRNIKALIDPSKVDVFLSVTDRNEATQILEHHYFIPLDNLSDMPGWLSDLISQAVTGAGISKRKLYTDDEDLIFQIKRAIAIGGIGQIIYRPDTMDRSILFKLSEISEEQRIPDQKLKKEFERIRPYLVGTAFDILSKAIAIYPTIELKRLPRMADFTLWGCAITEAMGIDRQKFLDAYGSNIGDQHREIIGGNTLAQAVIAFMDDKSEWEGTVGELFEKLHEIANPNKNDRSFPKASNKIRHAIGRINLNLIKFGVRITFSEYDTKKGMPVTIKKVPIKKDHKSIGTVWAPEKTNDINECAHSAHGAHKIATLLEDTKNDESYFIHEEDDFTPRLPDDAHNIGRMPKGGNA